MGEITKRSGGFRNLVVYRITMIIQDLTAIFVERYIRRGSRTVDQMEQAARSGKQNIAEGSVASATSRDSEMHLTNVARGSLKELLLDYEDYLRQHNLQQWSKDYPRTKKLRSYLRSEVFMNNPKGIIDRCNAEEFCNLCITLINQATYMLRRLEEAQLRMFQEEGGFKEFLYRTRTLHREWQRHQRKRTAGEQGRSDGSDGSDGSDKSDRSDTSD